MSSQSSLRAKITFAAIACAATALLLGTLSYAVSDIDRAHRAHMSPFRTADSRNSRRSRRAHTRRQHHSSAARPDTTSENNASGSPPLVDHALSPSSDNDDDDHAEGEDDDYDGLLHNYVDDTGLWSLCDKDSWGSTDRSLRLIRHIAERELDRLGYVHRGFSCSICDATPIRGTRYVCVNCDAMDICEECEAADTHPRTHILYKIRVPIPVMRMKCLVAEPSWYSTSDEELALPKELRPEALEAYSALTLHSKAEVAALYEQFAALATVPLPADANGIVAGGINEATFRSLLVRRNSETNLLAARIFHVYDTDHNGVIGFEEFLHGLGVFLNGSRMMLLKAVFSVYDLDNDGFVTAQDVVAVLMSHFEISHEVFRYMIGTAESMYVDRRVVMGHQPMSSAFTVGFSHSDHTGADIVPDTKNHDDTWSLTDPPHASASVSPSPQDSFDKLAAELPSGPLSGTEYESELKRITLKATQDVVEDIFRSAKIGHPSKGMSWDEFQAVAHINDEWFYTFLTCWSQDAVF
ncbi:uncharacterized protein V1518DRAFT_414548 [Limtongia smithiae]|uniref:uncharacterized protein n=1 Tax=Limtongia smithiae TaxID=1125753 RepID=UPI0034CFD446